MNEFVELMQNLTNRIGALEKVIDFLLKSNPILNNEQGYSYGMCKVCELNTIIKTYMCFQHHIGYRISLVVSGHGLPYKYYSDGSQDNICDACREKIKIVTNKYINDNENLISDYFFSNDFLYVITKNKLVL